MQYTALLLVALAGFVAADDVLCDASVPGIRGCIATVEANLLGSCPGGYLPELIQVPGYPQAIYCNRKCTPEETEDCRMKGCASYTSNCRSGTSTACSLAVKKCGGIVSDDVCILASPLNRKCQYNNKCQPKTAPCCPAAEDKENYVLAFKNIIKQGQKTVGILSSLCGFMDLVPFEELSTKYVTAGYQVNQGGDYTQIGVGCKDVKQNRIVYNSTRTIPEDRNAVAHQLMLDCEDAGGVYRFTKAG